jgi:hypothetical protein
MYPPPPGGGFIDPVTVAALRDEFRRSQNELAGAMRRDIGGKVSQQLSELAQIAAALRMERGQPSATGIVRVEDIPGRRVPYDLLVQIPISNNSTTRVEATATITQEGPFVAVKRVAAFESRLTYRVTSGGATNDFFGRSYGRFRPIHSAWDLLDAQSGAQVVVTTPPTIATMVGLPELTTTHAGFRSMEFDAVIDEEVQGSNLARQRISVPSAMWTTSINSPQELGCLDFFERGEAITFKVQPTHVNNPAFGNANGLNIFGAPAAWPFDAGQFDQQEGIVTPGAFTTTSAAYGNRIATDIVQRLPDGMLYIGLIGYRIQQTVGPVP